MFKFFYDLISLFSLFLIYALLGWIFEFMYTLIVSHKIVNRGFLIGPIIPIWGIGAIAITLLLNPADSPFSLLISSAFVGTALEYLVNYLMEKIFKARWWDYSDLPFNINGRVWLGSSIAFGIGGFCTIKFFNPFFYMLIGSIDKTVLCIIGSILFVLLIVDLCISCNIIKKLKLSAEMIKKDYTEEISKKVKAVLSEKSFAFKRLLKAFPNVMFFTKPKK
jgi:uncharacterized membrane protein